MTAESSFEAGPHAKVDWRLNPFLFLCYIPAFFVLLQTFRAWVDASSAVTIL
jgi:hypothetical protein